MGAEIPGNPTLINSRYLGGIPRKTKKIPKRPTFRDQGPIPRRAGNVAANATSPIQMTRAGQTLGEFFAPSQAIVSRQIRTKFLTYKNLLKPTTPGKRAKSSGPIDT